MSTTAQEARRALLREVAAEHGVPLEPDDPIVVLHTAISHIVSDASSRCEQGLHSALSHQAAEIEMLTSRLQEGLSGAARQLIRDIKIQTRAAIEDGSEAVTTPAMAKQAALLADHRRALARSTLVCTVASAVAVAAACVAILI